MRKKPQESVVAPNRGGSRSFGETRKFLESHVRKSGIKNVGTIGSSGPITSPMAQTRLAADPEEDLEQQDVDGNVLYKTTGGMPHCRLLITYGAVRTAGVVEAAKETNVRPSTSAPVS